MMELVVGIIVVAVVGVVIALRTERKKRARLLRQFSEVDSAGMGVVPRSAGASRVVSLTGALDVDGAQDAATAFEAYASDLDRVVENAGSLFAVSHPAMTLAMVREDLGKVRGGLRGQAEAWRAGAFRGQSVRSEQLLDGLQQMLRDLEKVETRWPVVGVSGQGLALVADLRQRLETLGRQLSRKAMEPGQVGGGRPQPVSEVPSVGATEQSATARPEVLAEIDAAIVAIRRARAQGLAGAGEPLRPTGVQVMKFPREHEQRFRLHSALLTDLARKGLLAKYKLWKLDLDGTGGFSGLLFVTGAADELTNYARYTYYLRDAEAFVAERCRNDWSQIDASSTESDVPAAGCKLDLSAAEKSLSTLASLVRPHAGRIVALTE